MGRVHSRYQRQPADTAAGGQEMLIRLQVRWSFRDNGGCAKATFGEQVTRLTTRYGRRTYGLDGAIALAWAAVLVPG